jgi:hypothetical protein
MDQPSHINGSFSLLKYENCCRFWGCPSMNYTHTGLAPPPWVSGYAFMIYTTQFSSPGRNLR